MTKETPKEQQVTLRARRVGKVMAFGFMLWMALQWLGGRLELPVKWSLALDFLALLAFMWAIYELWQIWRITRQN